MEHPLAQGCFHGMVNTKTSHSLTVFTATHVSCDSLNIWTKFCDKNIQLKVNNILNSLYYEIDAHMNNSIVQ
jgi:hypothetical protein